MCYIFSKKRVEMAHKLVSRTAKVLSETRKAKDKEAVAIAYEHIPRNPAEQQHGSIYAVIELEDKSGHAEEIAEKIIDILYENYYEDTDKEPVAAFEAALAKINDELTERSSEGQIEWLGKLNAVLAVLSGNSLHVTQAGKAEAYLYRGEHAMHITDGLAGDTINPQRTFINIATGDLTEKDRLAIVTPGVFFKVSKSELKKFATENSPKIAAEDLSKLLAGENGTTKPNAILLMEMVSPESFVSDETSEEQTEVWVPGKDNTGEKLGTGVADGTVKIFDYLGKAYNGASVFVTTKVLPGFKKGISGAKKKLQGFREEKSAESIILHSEETIAHPEITDLEIDSEDGILETPVSSLNDKEIRIKESHRKPKLLSLERFDFSFLDRAKSGLSGHKFRIKFPGKKFSFVYLGVAAALIVGLVLYFSLNGQMGRVAGNNEELQNKYNQAQTLYDESQTAITAGDFTSASEDLAAAEKLIKEVIGENYQVTAAEELLNKISASKDKANQITRNTATMIQEFEQPVAEIFSNGKLVYGVNFETGAVYSYDPVSKSTATIVNNNNLGSKIQFATLVASRNTLVAYTSNNELYEISMANGKAEKQTVSGTLEPAISMDFFGTNIYLLSVEENQVYKHFNTASGYGKKTNYFTEGPNLADVVDIAIDGSIYTTTATATVNKYTSGVRDEYALTGMPISYSSIKGIYSSADVEGVYLYTSDLVIKIDKNGKFVSQFAQDGATNISSVYVNEDGKIYFLSDNKLYSI